MQNQPSSFSASLIMDVLPSPTGYGFTDADISWQHPRSQSEREQLDSLMGLALLDQNVRNRLIVDHDPTLLDAFNLPDDTRHQLSSIRANTLKEFAQAVVASSTRRRA